MSWQAFIAGSVGVWAKKALASVGVGMIVYTGFLVFKGQIDSAIQNMFSGLPADAYQLFALAGLVDVVGVWLGALSAAAAFLSFRRLGLLA